MYAQSPATWPRRGIREKHLFDRATCRTLVRLFGRGVGPWTVRASTISPARWQALAPVAPSSNSPDRPLALQPPRDSGLRQRQHLAAPDRSAATRPIATACSAVHPIAPVVAAASVRPANRTATAPASTRSSPIRATPITAAPAGDAARAAPSVATAIACRWWLFAAESAAHPTRFAPSPAAARRRTAPSRVKRAAETSSTTAAKRSIAAPAARLLARPVKRMEIAVQPHA